MLLPVQTSGSKPPLFFVHGRRGIAISVGSRFAGMLGPDQPFYVINANGMDGRQPIIEHVPKMVAAYLREIRGARAKGAVRIGGMCAGGLVAIEIARALQGEGRQTGPVILVDPPVIPIGYERRKDTVDVRPELVERLYREICSQYLERLRNPNDYDDLPFNPHNPNQLHFAAVVAMRTSVAFARYVPRPFSGAAELIISRDRALGVLHPQMPWSKLFPRSSVHVLPLPHMKLFWSGRETVARLMRSILEEEPGSERVVERRMAPAMFDS